jgi:acyl-CoA thioesterase FadM
MDITSLAGLLSESAEVLCLVDGLRVVADAHWIVSGEGKLSYTTLLRLVECCREHHWQKDLRCRLEQSDIDTTCKTIKARFVHPVGAGQRIDIVYSVSEVRKRSYRIRFSVLDTRRLIQFAEVELAMVFVDTRGGGVTSPPSQAIEYLRMLCRGAGGA